MVNINASIIMDLIGEREKEFITCHDCPSNYEVENYKEGNDVEKEELILKIRYEKVNNESTTLKINKKSYTICK